MTADQMLLESQNSNRTIIRHIWWTSLILVSLTLGGCRKTKTTTTDREPLRDRPSGQLLKLYAQKEFQFEWLAMKLDADLVSNGESRGFKANVRMRRDSVIWISVTPALGIEVFRVLVTPDSLKYISRIPDDKYYFLGSFQAVNSLMGIEVDFVMLQDLLVGNAIGLDPDEGRFRSEVDGDDYLLTSKYRRKVRRVVGVDDRKLSQEDTIVVNPEDPRYRRAMRRSDDDDLIISRYWLDGQTYRLVKSVFNDLLRQRAMELEYRDFQEESGQLHPSRVRLTVREPGKQQTLSFRITKIASGKTHDFPFDIPTDFERKLSP